MFVDLFKTYKNIPKPFLPFPNPGEREVWDLLPKEALGILISKGEKALNQPWCVLTASDYSDFTKTGRRVLFEEKYFARRHKLNDLVMAEIAEWQGRFVDEIINGIWLICEESGWQLPAHNTYVRDTPQHPLPDNKRPVLDLFACETGASLAFCHYMLGEKLSPVSERILDELNERIIKPYTNEHFWWMGSGDEKMCNWTPWCTQNVLIVSALLGTTCGTVEKACRSLDYFIKDYDKDGSCDEGAKYYGHAALCLYGAMEMLCGITNGHFNLIYENEKIRNMADFIRHMHISDDYYFNFADCPPKLPPPGALEFLFGLRTKNPYLCKFAADGIKKQGLFEPSTDLSLFTRLSTLFVIDAVEKFTDEFIDFSDRFFSGAGVLVARDTKIAMAVKAGNNGDNHNHNDVGSLTLYFNGKPFLIDVGVGTYKKDTFSPERYNIWTMQSAYHNLPTFNGIMQEPGADYKASDVSYFIGKDDTQISMDISGAYPKEAELMRYTRTVRLKKGIGVFIKDEFDGKIPATLSLMLCNRPIINIQSVMLDDVGELYTDGQSEIKLEEININDPKLLEVWPRVIYRLLITFEKRLLLHILPI